MSIGVEAFEKGCSNPESVGTNHFLTETSDIGYRSPMIL